MADADGLAILQAKPRLLFEVKEFDHLNPTNLDQIVDYLRQVKKGVGFVCVYRFLPQPDVVERIRELSDEYPATLLSYNEIHEALKPAGTEVSPLARLIAPVGTTAIRSLVTSGMHD